MITIKINGEKQEVKRLSDLTFFEFNEVIIKKQFIELPQYLASQCNISVKQMLESEVTGISLPSLYATLFNVNIDEVVKDKKETILFRGEHRAMSSVSINSFGKSYNYELRRQVIEDAGGNAYELSIHGLSIALSDSPEASDAKEIYKDLCGMNWMKVLPQAFFLVNRTKLSRIKKLLFSMIYIGELKMIRLKMAYYLKGLRKSEKK